MVLLILITLRVNPIHCQTFVVEVKHYGVEPKGEDSKIYLLQGAQITVLFEYCHLTFKIIRTTCCDVVRPSTLLRGVSCSALVGVFQQVEHLSIGAEDRDFVMYLKLTARFSHIDM